MSRRGHPDHIADRAAQLARAGKRPEDIYQAIAYLEDRVAKLEGSGPDKDEPKVAHSSPPESESSDEG